MYRLDVDNTIAMLVHHGAQQLLEPLQFDAIAHWLPLISNTENKRHSVLECPNLQACISYLEQTRYICCESLILECMQYKIQTQGCDN